MNRLLISAAVLATITATPALARPMTSEDVAKIEYVGGIAISPDGKRIAYTTVSRPDITEGEKDGGAEQQLKLAWAANQARDFLPDDMNVSSVKFSPDGRTISFLYTAEDEKRAVWGIPVDGGAERKLAAVDKASVSSYAWSADGSKLYLLASAAPDKMRDEEKDAGFDAIVYEEEARLNRMFVARVGDEIDAAPVAVTIPGYVDEFQVTPDGRTAIVGSSPTPQVDDTYTKKQFQLVDLATGKVTRVIGTTGKVGDADVSPDGKTMAMIAGVDQNDPAPTTLYLVDLASGTMRALNEGAAEAANDAEWMADGRLAVAVDVGAQSVLRFYNADGSMAQQVDPGELIIANIETAGGTLAMRASSPTHPLELYSFDGTGFTRWTNHNPWLSEIDFGAQRTYRYNARDGQEIEGVLIEPVGGAPRGGAPLILDVHGGPEAHESNGWVTEYGNPGQVAAGQGYAVFLPNYRGSTAYGTAFSKQHQGRYTDPEFTDLVDAKRALVQDGIADPDRTGITGGSYGGYATGWAATALSDEFAAGVMFVGISNQISKFGTTDIPWEMYNVHSRAWPWDDWQKMLEVSPIYHVEKAQTPLLILHGEEDTRVSPSQSYELYRNIKVRKPEVPVRLVLYPGEGHGNAGAAARYDYNLRMMRWFDTYLKTGDADAPLPAARPPLPAAITGADDDD